MVEASTSAAAVERIQTARTLRDRGDYDNALRELVVAAELDLRGNGGYIIETIAELAAAQFDRGAYGACADACDWHRHLREIARREGHSAAAHHFRDPGMWIRHAVSQAVGGDWTAARATVEDGLAHHPGNDALQQWLVVAHGATGGRDAAGAAWERVYPDEPYDGGDLVLRGVADIADRAERAGMDHEALQHWSKHWYEQAYVYGRLVANLFEWWDLLHPVIRVYRRLPAPPPLPPEAVEAARRAEDHATRGEAAAAQHAYDEALAHAPWWADAYYNLAVIHEAAGSLAGVVAVYLDQYLAFEPEGSHAKSAQKKLKRIEKQLGG